MSTAQKAFGVDPTRRNLFSLRQSRYDALAHDISKWAGIAARSGRRLSVLDVGCGWGPLLCHLQAKPHFAHIALSATDLSDDHVQNKGRYERFVTGDLQGGYPDIPSAGFDIVVCEQVLEHLSRLDVALAELERMLKPGGILVIGVPIFVPPLHHVRKHVIPKLDGAFSRHHTASHLQAFSLKSFLAEIQPHPQLRLLKVRGFRIISGGLLRPLENYRWWWKLNRALGELMPGACIEIQAILRKRAATAASVATAQPASRIETAPALEPALPG